MKEKEFRKIVKEEIKKILDEAKVPDYVTGVTKSEPMGGIISQIYQWIIRGDMEKAIAAMQNDPVLIKLASNVETLKKELIKRMSHDDKMLELVAQSVERLKKQRDAK